MGVSTKNVAVDTKITIEEDKNSQESDVDNKENEFIDE
jgi:hypothetical protein